MTPKTSSKPTFASRLFTVQPMVHPEVVRQGWMKDNRLHNFLVLLYHLARVRLPFYAVILAALVGGVAMLFVSPLAAAAVLGGALTLDLGLLALLPRIRASFGWIQPPWLLFGLGRLVLALLIATLPLTSTVQVSVLAAVQAALTLLSWYGSLVEPFWIEHTELKVPLRGVRQELLVLLLTDLHMERLTRREEAVLDAVAERRPDLVLLGGDLLNLSYVGDPEAIRHARTFLSRLGQPGAGTYLVRGTPDVDPPEIVSRILEGLPVIELCDDIAEVIHHQTRLTVIGLPAERSHQELKTRLDRLVRAASGRAAACICLHHTPDLVEEASRLDLDLYLAGHTHGGQICVPLLGPLATASRFGRRYVRGLHQVGSTTAYISRGLGLEGLGAPRMRFLARPELIWIRLVAPDA